MANWAYVKDNQIDSSYDQLPKNWQNISNFFALSSELAYLKSLGWYAVVKPPYDYDPNTQKLDNPRLIFENDTVTELWDIVPIPQPVPPEYNVDVFQAQAVEQVKIKLDEFAQTRGYDNILSACSYASDPNPQFQAEGLRCVELRSATWSSLFNIIQEVRDNTRPLPQSFNEIEYLLPELSWPE